VVALDDGSTDGTAARLAVHPAVLALLRNPIRRTYAGWDDARNRSRLLAAAGRFRPDWIVQLDADERMDAARSLQLRRFLETEACPEFAYGFYLCRMIGDERHFDKSMEIFRVFAYRDGLRLPSRKLHLIPVPDAIKRERWFTLRIRIQHLSGLTPRLRRRRFKKYEEADPENEWQPAYDNLLSHPTQVKRWRQPPGRTLLADPARHAQAVATVKQIAELLGSAG
jgi:glycosyltransferase involved in cell wall biosynthesis